MKPRPTSSTPDAGLRRKSLAILLVICLTIFLFIDLRSSAQGALQVTAADPASAAQGTVNLNVKVTGKGFKKGAQAKWLKTGTDDEGGVSVNSTTFVSSTELTANITVADNAAISAFDIKVVNSDGRGGKGTELFSVTSNAAAGGPSACTVQPLPAGISLVGSLNSLGPGGTPTFGPGFGTTVRAKQMVLNGAQVLVVGITNTPSATPRLEIFFVDPLTGQILDGTMIGSGTAAQPHLSVTGPRGRSLAVGDVNADGIPDFVSGLGANAAVGSISGGVLSYQNYALPLPANAVGAGWGVAMGDLNGTGSDVIAVGSVGDSRTAGQVSLFTWNGSGFTNTQNITSQIPNPKKNESFGYGVAIADVTGSSDKDLIVGAPGSNVNGQTGAGRVFVFPGPVSASTYLTFATNVKDDSFGRKLASGDLNGDSLSDLLGTTAWNNNDIKANSYLGSVFQGQAANFVLRPVNGLGGGWSTTEPDSADLNSDGQADVLIGAPNAASGPICGGVAYLYLSNAGTPLASRLMLSTPVLDPSGSDSFQGFGWAVAFAGSGSRLFFVSDNGVNLGPSGVGQVYIFKLN